VMQNGLGEGALAALVLEGLGDFHGEGVGERWLIFRDRRDFRDFRKCLSVLRQSAFFFRPKAMSGK
jgi:hypothetical protein